MFDCDTGCLFYDVDMRYTQTNLRLTLTVWEILKVDLDHIMIIYRSYISYISYIDHIILTLTILYYEYYVFEQNCYSSRIYVHAL